MTTAVVEALETLYGVAPPPCEATGHEGGERPPAEWLVRWEYCCPDKPAVALFCTPCMDGMPRLPNLTCMFCRHRWAPAARAILSGHAI